MPDATRPVIVVEDDAFTRIIGVALDPATAPERVAAFAQFFSHDLPDFDGWLARVRKRVGALYPAQVQLVDSPEAMLAALPNANALVVEGWRVGSEELAQAPRLKLVQKFGALTGNIDPVSCAQRGVTVKTLRRRVNMACAEHALALMLALARKIVATNKLVSMDQLQAAGYEPLRFDRRHTANSNWARITGLRTLNGARFGVLGMGEIGREVAARARAFGMDIVYTQRTRLTATEEEQYGVQYMNLDELLAESDYVCPCLPGGAATRGILGARELGLMKPGSFLVNVARAELVDRAALLDVLRRGRLGGYATDLPYDEPGDANDPLLAFPNVIVTPHTAGQPRFNALNDLEDLMAGMAQALQCQGKY